MSKNLSLTTVVEKNRLSSDTPFVVCLEITVKNPATGATVETLRVVKNSEDIVLNGNTFVAADFDIELKEESGAQPEVNLSVVDISRALQARMEAYGGGIGFPVKIMIVNAAELTQEPQVIEYFETIGASAQEYNATFVLGAENHLAKAVPARIQRRDFCPYRFKDPNSCRYVGGLTTCDLTLQGANGCEVHANTVNFGAYPGLHNINVRYG